MGRLRGHSTAVPTFRPQDAEQTLYMITQMTVEGETRRKPQRRQEVAAFQTRIIEWISGSATFNPNYVLLQ
jgi:hypothetical protein